MKLFILPVVISTFIISQVITSSVAATGNTNDCMASIFESSGASSGTINDTCLESMFSTTTTVNISNNPLNAATPAPSDISNGISDINKSITELATMNSAPVVENNYVYNSWELMQRTSMLAGFMWTGEIANFITPAMYIGTPFEHGGIYTGGNNPYAAMLKAEPTTYAECITHEAYLSYGLGDLIESTDIKELKAIAKACAKEYYGSYFKGKTYTTREEFLMMLFTMFEEPVTSEGTFDTNGSFIPNGNGIDSHFSNVSPKSWYAPYLALADNLALLPIQEMSWQTAKEISDTEAIEILSAYTAYRMNFNGDLFERGIITTEKVKYTIAFPNANEVSIKIQ